MERGLVCLPSQTSWSGQSWHIITAVYLIEADGGLVLEDQPRY